MTVTGKEVFSEFDEDERSEEGDQDDDDEDENESEVASETDDDDVEEGQGSLESDSDDVSDIDDEDGNDKDHEADAAANVTDTYADEPNTDKTGEKDKDEKQDQRRRGLLLCGACFCCLIIILAIVLGLVLGGKDDDKKQTDQSRENTSGPMEAPTLVPVIRPTVAPATLATLAPTRSVNSTESPTVNINSTDSPNFAFNETEADTNATFFPVVSDTYIADGASADQAFGTSVILEVASDSRNQSSMALLLFDLDLLPPESDSIFTESSIVLRLVTAGDVVAPFSETTVSLLSPQGESALGNFLLDFDLLTWNDLNGTLAEFLTEGAATFTGSSDTPIVEVDITKLLQPGIALRRRELQNPEAGIVVLVLRIAQVNSPGNVSFQSSEAGADVSPVIVQKYVEAKITSCAINPCGKFATCWEDNFGGPAFCECDDALLVDYLEPCPTGSFTCPFNTAYDAEVEDCVCPVGKNKTDTDGFCFAAGSPCLDDPCTGVGSLCQDNSTSAVGYICKCSDDSVVAAKENCDFATIVSCVPYPCAPEASCSIDENEKGEITFFCQCDDGSAVEFGESCTVV